ncbi:MAG: agmatinase [Deltaproteobacteria bacterium RBG_16_49_23]|nr:MAG: agmatinase [Deltaproteobacteria bacterium RBG_16_49_23]
MKSYGRVNLPFTGIASFCKFPVQTDLNQLSADAAIFGVPWDEGTGYRPGSRFGPRSIREYSTRFAFHERGVKKRGYWNIENKERDLENIQVVDCGDQDVLYLKVDETFSAITDSIKKILSRKAFPVILGGDHSVAFPVVRAFRKFAPLHVIHLDAHLDYNDSIEGVLLANGNPIKRISELNFVGRIIQIGMRGIRTREDAYQDSRARGNKIFTMSEFRRVGVEEALSSIPGKSNCYVTIDMDVLDPSIAPGTSSPEFDGMTYGEIKALLEGIASRGKVLGFDVVEVNPFLDPIGLTQTAAAMLILEFLGAIFKSTPLSSSKRGKRIK